MDQLFEVKLGMCRDVSAGFEIPEFEFVGLKIRLSGATGQNRA